MENEQPIDGSEIKQPTVQDNNKVETSPNNPPPLQDGSKPIPEIRTGEEKVKDYSSKIAKDELWKTVLKLTKPIDVNISEGSIRNFYWPEHRKAVENVIEDLVEKRILFVRSNNEDWLFAAVQRLSGVLQSSKTFSRAVIRRTQSKDISDKQLDFGFWIGERPLPYPVVVFIAAGRLDFFQKFLNQQIGTVLNDFIPELVKLNLYLVCEIDETSDRQLFSNPKPWVMETFAFWNIPIVKLQLLKQFNKQSEAFYSDLINKKTFGEYGEAIIYEQIKKLNSLSEEQIKSFNQKLSEIKNNTAEKVKELTSITGKDKFIQKLLVFCGAFFESIYYPDFFKLISTLLENEVIEIEPEQTTGLPKQHAITKRSLKSIWESDADSYMDECMLKTKKEGSNLRVEFAVPSMAKQIADYIEQEKYPFFHKIYKNFINSDLLINTKLSEKLEAAVLDFFARAASMDTATHNAVWLKNVVHDLWKNYDADLPENSDYESIMFILRQKQELQEIVKKRIPSIISSLLIKHQNHFNGIVKEFFRLLLNERDAKKMAIIIATHIYKEREYTKAINLEDPLEYFRRTLEEGNWDDSFFSYDALIDNINYIELWTETQSWLNDSTLNENDWTKHFAYLYQLDYIIATLYRYFRKFKADGVYELWEKDDVNCFFPEIFSQLVENLLQPNSIKGIATILEAEANVDRFKWYVRLFESIESNEIRIANDRFKPPYNTAISLIADIIECWFYILTLLTYPSDPITTSTIPESTWIEYAQLIKSKTDSKTLSSIKKCCSAKAGFYSVALSDLAKDNLKNNAGLLTYKKQLGKRRSCVHMLTSFL